MLFFLPELLIILHAEGEFLRVHLSRSKADFSGDLFPHPFPLTPHLTPHCEAKYQIKWPLVAVNFLVRFFALPTVYRFIMKNKKVLIIDDEEDFGHIMTAYFAKKGFKVFVESTISGGLKMLASENPDYILLDNNLPDGFGWSETDFILKNYPNAHLTLISGLDGPMTSAATFQILYKPFVKDDLNKIFNFN